MESFLTRWLGVPANPAPPDADGLLTSCLCTERTLLRPDFQDWAERLGESRGHLHRKVWEWAYICQALAERGMLRDSRRGLGFAVGREVLPALFARAGARITATDQAHEAAEAAGWVGSGQHADSLQALCDRAGVELKSLEGRLEFKHVDMNRIDPAFAGQYDFTWSACALEHLGSIDRGARFILQAMRCLKPGGVAVHTTEFNVSSDDDTVERGDTVLFRRRDIEDIAERLRSEGHGITLDLQPGSAPNDAHIDVPPYKHDVHLKLQLGRYTITSIGLIVRKAG